MAQLFLTGVLLHSDLVPKRFENNNRKIYRKKMNAVI